MATKQASTTTKPATTTKAVKKYQPDVLSLMAPMGLIIAAALIAPHVIPPQTPASTKPFGSFEEFFPFYMSQHADTICRRLHIIGTSIVIIYALFEPFTLPSLILGGLVGSVIFPATRGMESGLLEGFLMIFTFLYFMRRFTGDWKRGLVVPIVAYSFAWFGHFFFEHNRPATFIYPLFSLMGDFRMCFETYAMQRKF
jgi:hypothetical protein|mmetsp:Transcript_9554/g.10274  ORF Transcript_9554/g.10274 Transcript_9554/m.10274 type:complete len:198 (-) Transcript_9554:134-727(-)|eukprot:gene9595-10418_t